MERQLIIVKTRISTLHEDLQYDYEQELNMVEVWLGIKHVAWMYLKK